MHIKGWVPVTLVDYAGKIAASLFCGGCNFRCPNCHNRDLVLRPKATADIPLSELWSFLETRVGLLDGIVISGGEPTLQADLLSFALRLREMGFEVKLDTNGYRPDVLKEAIDREAVDYVAMDVKAPLAAAQYARAAGTRVDVGRIRRSIDLLRGSGIACEFRTTVVPGMLEEEDIAQIAEALAPTGAARAPDPIWYYLQQFAPHNTLDPQMLDLTPYSPQRLQGCADAARHWLANVGVRGV